MFALCVGTGDTFFGAPRALIAVGSVWFSRQFLAVYQWVPVFARIGVCGRKTERVCVPARLAAHILISAKAPFPSHGASLRVTARRNFLLWCVCHHQIRFLVNLLGDSSPLLSTEFNLQFNWLLSAAPFCLPEMPLEEFGSETAALLWSQLEETDQAVLRPWPFSVRQRG